MMCNHTPQSNCCILQGFRGRPGPNGKKAEIGEPGAPVNNCIKREERESEREREREERGEREKRERERERERTTQVPPNVPMFGMKCGF